jgi:hypothetical protein
LHLPLGMVMVYLYVNIGWIVHCFW